MNYSGTALNKPDFALEEFSTPSLSPRALARFERDRERGYSINAKQIVLAFGVEFVIIGLILTNVYVTVAQLPDQSTFKIVQALLFPIAMAMVELARVPLAIAVRTQNSWNIKLAALLGVLCAVAVTSNSLYSIGASSFTPRLVDTHNKDADLARLKSRKEEIENHIAKLQSDVVQKNTEKENTNKTVQSLNEQLNRQPPQNCLVVPGPSPAPGAPSTSTMRCVANPVLKTLNSEIAAAKTKVTEAEAVLKQVQTVAQKAPENEELRFLNEEIRKAETASDQSIFQSQLHSLAGMLFRVDPKDVTAAQIKTLEFYLIFVSSIAAAFSSTLIAMTAVRRIKPQEKSSMVTIPDEAAAYLFGPLVSAIRKEALDAVAAASEQMRNKS
jgi:peptidoglycan hydrolase CwlO-like protein